MNQLTIKMKTKLHKILNSSYTSLSSTLTSNTNHTLLAPLTTTNKIKRKIEKQQNAKQSVSQPPKRTTQQDQVGKNKKENKKKRLKISNDLVIYSNQPLRHKQRSYKEEKKQQLEKGINTGKKIHTYIYKIKQQIIEN